MKKRKSASHLSEVGSVAPWVGITSQSLLEALKERDPYTYGHSMRVARHAKLLAKACGLTETEQTKIEYASFFHDLGKVGIPDSVIFKPSRLSDEEMNIIQAHPEKSVKILEPLRKNDFFESLIPGILHHHERIDGEGYPHKLIGEHIPLDARIILVVDTFDAMTTNRPYRGALPYSVAYQELKKFSGRQFDSQLVQIFLEAHPHWAEHEPEIREEFIAAHFKRAA